MDPGDFADRYLVASFPSGGVVVDLETGNYFRVDSIAAAACAALSDGEADSAVDKLARHLSVERPHAGRIIADTLKALAAAPVVGTPAGPYHFHREDDGFGLWHDGKRVVVVSDGELEITVPADGRGPLLEFYMRAVAPKILFIRGVSVLHASACAAHGKLIAFAGMSGAGKTTTARAFVDSGARSISEDLVVLRPGAHRPSVVLDGEARVHAWAKSISARLAAGQAKAPSTDLFAVADGLHAPLDVVHFLDVSRRHAGSTFELRRMGGPEGLLALMANDFLGDSSRDGWRRYFLLAQSMAASLDLIEANAPTGIPKLAGAARLYMSTWTS